MADPREDMNYDDLETLITQRDALDAKIAEAQEHEQSLRGALGRAKMTGRDGPPVGLRSGEREQLKAELSSPLDPTEYHDANAGFMWDDTDPDPEKPQGSARAAQGMIDELGPSIAPLPPDEPGDYAWSHNFQSWLPEDNESIPAEDSPEAPMDFGRGVAYSDFIGNSFYQPYDGPNEGRSLPLPNGISGSDFENYMDTAEMPASEDRPEIDFRPAGDPAPNYAPEPRRLDPRLRR